MKTKNVKKNKGKQFVLKILIGAVIGLSFGFGVGKMIKTNDRLVTSIKKNLQQNCNCESVEASWSAVGIQFNKEDGFSNKRLSFTLENCKTNFLTKEESIQLNKVLVKEVENYNNIDVLNLEFVSENNSENLKIRKGEIVQINNDKLTKI